MHTNPFNPYCFDGRSRSNKQLPNSGSPRRTVRGDLMTLCLWGGLKGKTAPGDAHPYLALFYLEFFCLYCTTTRLYVNDKPVALRRRAIVYRSGLVSGSFLRGSRGDSCVESVKLPFRSLTELVGSWSGSTKIRLIIS